MNYSARKRLWALIAVLAVVLIVLAVLLVSALRPEKGDAVQSAGFLTGEGALQPRGESAEQAEEGVAAENIIAEVAEDNMAIETPVCTLYYPREWESFLRISMTDGEPCTVVFSAELPSAVTAELFTVDFSGEGMDILGCLTTAEGERVSVSVRKHELIPEESWTEEDLFILQAMQSAVRVLESNLPPLESVIPEDAYSLPEDDGQLLTVETPWTALSYPARWEEYLTTAVDEKARTVTFFGTVGEREPVELFVLCFGGEEGALAGTVSTPEGEMDLLVRMGEQSFDDSWSEDEKNIVYAMREGINDLLGMLA